MTTDQDIQQFEIIDPANPLRPCPFCGGSAVLLRVPAAFFEARLQEFEAEGAAEEADVVRDRFYATCDKTSNGCGVLASTQFEDDPGVAASEWNGRDYSTDPYVAQPITPTLTFFSPPKGGEGRAS